MNKNDVRTIFKKDLIAEYAAIRNITKVEAEERIEDIIELVCYHLVSGDDVKLNNFFNFFNRTLDSKKGKNPFTKEDMIIPSVRSVHVKMTKPLKDKVQGKR